MACPAQGLLTVAAATGQAHKFSLLVLPCAAGSTNGCPRCLLWRVTCYIDRDRAPSFVASHHQCPIGPPALTLQRLHIQGPPTARLTGGPLDLVCVCVCVCAHLFALLPFTAQEQLPATSCFGLPDQRLAVLQLGSFPVVEEGLWAPVPLQPPLTHRHVVCMGYCRQWHSP